MQTDPKIATGTYKLLLFSYADARQDLPGVKQEVDFHAELFKPGTTEPRFIFFREPQANNETLSNWLVSFRKMLFLFHYSGHAGNEALQLENDDEATSEGIASLLALCPDLKLVVLNGCSTAGHISALRRAGVDAIIIATNWLVDDLAASLFSQRFYAALERGEYVDEAFDQATAHILLSGKIEIERGLQIPASGPPDRPVWGMYSTSGILPSKTRLPVSRSYPSKPLPIPGHFVGRERRLARIINKLEADRATAICIAGPLGIGKSALCRQTLWANAVRKKFGQQIFFVNCESTVSTNDLKYALGDRLGITPKGDLESQIWERLHGSPKLIALDNAETPYDKDRTRFQQFLQDIFGMGNVSLILTIRGQQIPRGLPWEEPVERLGTVSENEAREIFVKNAGRPEFLHDPYLPTLLSRLGGHPLTLVLMAGQAEIESHLAPLLQRLEQGGAGIFSEDKIDSAVEFLLASKRMSAEGRKLFSLLSILPAGIHRDQLAILTPGYGSAGARALFGTGLAHYDELQRLQMPAPVRAYGKSNCPPASAVFMPVINYYCDLIATTRDLGGENGPAIAGRLVPELGNIEKITNLAIDIEPERGIRAALDLSRFTAFTRLGNIKILVRALKIARVLDKKHLTAECLDYLGRIRPILTSDYGESGRLFTEALDLSNQTQSMQDRANSFLNLGDFAFFENREDQAESYYRQALHLFTENNSRKGMAVCSLRLGEFALQKDDRLEAKQLLKQALSLYQKEDSIMGRASCLLLLGEVAFEEMKRKKAVNRYQDALHLVKEVGHVEYITRCLEGLGKISFQYSDFHQAISHYREAARIYRENTDLTGRAKCLSNLGEAYLRLPDTDMARQHLQEALKLFQQDGNRLGAAECTRLLAAAAYEDSDYENAISLLDSTLVVFDELNKRSYLATSLRTLADIYAFQEEYPQAAQLYDHAKTLFEEEYDEIGVAECRWGLGDMLRQMQRPDSAKLHWQLTVETYEKSEDYIALAELYEKLAQVTAGKEREQYRVKAAKMRKKLGDL